MSQATPPVSPDQPPQTYNYPPPRGNGFAVASLVFGMVMCIPLLTGFLAIGFGVVGIRTARNPQYGGKGLAMAGLILGIVNLIGWTGMGGFFWHGLSESKVASAVAEQFLKDMCDGKVNNAVANSSGLTAAQLQPNVPGLTQFGRFQSVSFTSFNYNAHFGSDTVKLGGIATFSEGVHTVTFELVQQGTTYKVTGYLVQ